MQTMRFREKEGRPNFLGNTLWYCGVDFYIELFDNKKFGKVFILPGHFSHGYDMILYFVRCIILFVRCPVENRRGFVWN